MNFFVFACRDGMGLHTAESYFNLAVVKIALTIAWILDNLALWVRKPQKS